MNKENNDTKDEDVFEYYEYAELLENLEYKANENYDKAILSLSGGALFLSFTFIKNILGQINTFNYLLPISWGLWTASILAVILGLWSSQIALRKASTKLHKTKKIDGIKDITNKFDELTKYCNWSSGTLFIVGTITFLIFSFQSLGEISMSKENKKQEEIINEMSQKIAESIISVLEKHKIRIVEKAPTIPNPRKDKPTKK